MHASFFLILHFAQTLFVAWTQDLSGLCTVVNHSGSENIQCEINQEVYDKLKRCKGQQSGSKRLLVLRLESLCAQECHKKPNRMLVHDMVSRTKE